MMSRKGVMYWLVCLHAVFIICAALDPCEEGGENHLQDISRRFTAYKTDYSSGVEMMCDKYTIPQHGAWFMAYNDMPTKPPTFLDCGTTHPIWLNGTLPTREEGIVTRTACKVGSTSYCELEIPIKIKRCKRYTAYFLMPTQHCPEAYCFGLRADPPLPQPVIRPGITQIDGVTTGIEFECYMNISTLNYAYYTVEWKWGTSGSLKLKNDSENFHNLKLTDEHFKSLGVDITCTVTALHYKDDQNGSSSTSERFYAGIEVKESFTMIKGGSLTIPFKLTVPFACHGNVTCGIDVSVKLTTLQIDSSCTGRLDAFIPRRNKSFDITEEEWDKTHYIQLNHIGRKGYGVNPNSFQISLTTRMSTTRYETYKKLTEIKIRIEDSHLDRKMCSAINDPHMTTFDGLHYEHQQPGTYILYEHQEVKRYMQVQMELTPCNGARAYCICGLAVRAGADVFIMYLCHKNTIIDYATCGDKILRVQRSKHDSREYKITFPTGTEVSSTIFINGWYGGTMNVNIRASGDDFGSSQGLCGRLANNQSQNLYFRGTNRALPVNGGSWFKPTNFSDSWRVKDNENLFFMNQHHHLESWEDDLFNPKMSTSQSCQSEQGFSTIDNTSCNGNRSMIIPMPPETTVTTITNTEPSHKWNETSAKNYCKSEISETDAYKACTEYKEKDWNHYFDMCWKDIMLTDSTLWAQQTVDDLIKSCKGEVVNEGNTTTTNVTKILSLLCPGNCNNNGQCSNAVCKCDDGYLGSDCGTSITNPPKITAIQGTLIEGIVWCDIAKTDCHKFVLTTEVVHLTVSLSCRVQTFLVYTNSTEVKYFEEIVNADVASMFSIWCKLNRTTNLQFQYQGLFVVKYVVSVSYNKQNFSTSVNLHSYNSECQQMFRNRKDGNIIILLKSTNCFLDGYCFSDGQVNQKNSFQFCNVTQNELVWSFDHRHNCHIKDTYYHNYTVNANLTCLLCDPGQDSYSWTIKNGCYIDGHCYHDKTDNPDNDLYICNTTEATTYWSYNGTLLAPVIKPHIVNKTGHRKLEFECFIDTTKLNFTYYKVSWYWGKDRHINMTNTSATSPELRLSGDMFDHFGILISCTVEGLHQLNKSGPLFHSKTFLAGIKTDNSITIRKGEEAVLRYQLTLPLCVSSSTCGTHLQVSINLPYTSLSSCHDELVMKSDACNTIIRGSEWNSTSQIVLRHKPSRNYGVYPDRFTISLTSSSNDSRWNNIYIPEIEVTVLEPVIEWHSKVCSAYNDPHMTTFDGLHYEHQYSGTYLLYKNTVGGVPFEVQMDLTSCYSNKVFCPCGVAVRAGADVFMINYCDRWSVTQFVSCEKEPVLQVTKQIGNNRNFRVRFPSGTAVFIQVVHLNPVNLLNLEIRPTASDVENSTGLCGTLSNTCTDDFKLSNGTTRYTDASCPNTVNKEFSESWRIRDDENLFKINNSSVFKTWHEQVSQSYCGCSTNDSVCVPKTLYPEICQDNGYEAVQTTCRESVGKSSFALTIPEKEIITHTLTEPVKPDKTNITKEEARSFCEWIMRNTSSICSPVRNLHTEYFLEICVLDIMSTNSKMWIAQTHDIMKARCVYEIQTNVQSNQTTGVETILSHLCPGSKVCSGHGACKNGICHCDDNYISNDCSVDITMPPIIFEIQYHGLCRFGFDSCRTVLVYGRNIHESKQMYCKISKIYVVKMEASTQEIIGSTVVIKAKTSSVMKIECDFTLATFTEIIIPYTISGYQVAVGYNNENFTRAMKYYEYHRECQSVHGQDANRTFFILDGTCFIDDQCYKHLDNNTNNEYEYCDSRLTKIEWSFDKENTCKINGTFYPKNERRGDNQCLLCNPALSPYNWTLDEDKCYIDSKCLQRNTKNPKDNDEFCNPDLDKFNWTFNESALQPEVRAHLEQVHQTLMNVDIEKLYFECYLDMSRLAYTLYEVTWNWGHNSALTLEANKTSLDKLRLTEDFFKTLGTHVNCTIQGKINSTDLSGTVFKSQSFFAGVVVEESMTIQKGQMANLRYHLTVPFGCLSIGNIYPPCFIELNMLSPEQKTTRSCSGDIVNLQHCRVKIYRDHWNSSFSLAIKHRGRQMYGVYPEMINLKLHTSSADHALWDSTKIPNIKVNVIDVPKDLQQKVCSAYNAHLSTFDGLRYEHQHGGVFTLYHHRTADKYMMVQIQYAPCDESQNLFCICGVAVRAGGDIYVINFCNGMNLIQYLSCQQKLLHVVAGEKDNKKYKVTLPSGTEVMVNVKYIGVRTFMTVEIRASDSDLDNTEGLCGTLNNNCSDDFTLANGTIVKPSNQHCDTALDVHVESKIFSQHWSVKDHDDLFALDSRRSIELWDSYEEYCSCPSSAVSDNFECSPMSTVTCSQEKGYKTIGVSTCALTNVTGLIRTRNSSEIIPEERRRGNESFTLLTAEEKCRSSIENSTAFISCSAVPNVPTEYFIKICALEVETSGSLTWIDHTLNTLKVRCLSEVQWNGTLNSPTEDDRATVTETVILSLCPGNPECSGHGKCVKGVCVCDEGLMSDDCSMDKVLPPQIYSTRGEGVCDLNQINCDTAFVIGERIEESDEMSCKITKHILHPDGSQTFAGTTIVNGKLETLVEVHCPLTSTRQRRSADIGEVPFVEMFDVSVGYNKNNFSAPQRIYNINSKCQEKTGTDNNPEFKLKEKMCFIEKECYHHGDRRVSKDLFYCDADEDPYNWSFNKTQSCLVEDILYQKNEKIVGRECLYCAPSISWFNWTLAEGYCILDGKCVRHNDKMSEDECMYCNSNLDKFGWTRSDEVCVKKVPQGTGDIHPTSSLAVILFSSVGAVVLVIVSVLTLNWYIKNKAGRKTKKYTESTEDQLSRATDNVYHMPKARLR